MPAMPIHLTALLLGSMFAQTQSDPISGGAGWVGAGLLGAVLAWVFFWHLPAKDKQLKEFIDGKDAHITHVTNAYRQEMKEVRDEFRAALVQVLESHQDQVDRLCKAIQKEFEMLKMSGSWLDKPLVKGAKDKDAKA